MKKHHNPILEQILKNLKFESLNPMQEKMIDVCRKKNHILLLAPTGSGKTVSFLLPVLERIRKEITGVQALILVPSRELALQIEHVFRSMGTGYKVICCYGGHPIKTEINSFSEPPQLLIGTPGRIAAHIRRGSFLASKIYSLVLDEFDKSLEFGFENEMSFIIRQLPGTKIKILTSATQSVGIPEFAGVTYPETIDFHEEINSPDIEIKSVRATEKDKLDILFRLICHIGNEPALVFCNHREAVDRISELLEEKGIFHDTFHGGLEQAERERALIKFRNGSHHLLITTDLASRGLDIPEIRNIIHYQTSTTETSFIHRNGRTARMNASGTVWLVLSETEPLPDFLHEMPVEIKLSDLRTLPKPPFWETIYISGGKKDKINKVDIVGFLIQKGELQKEDIGLISVLDYESFAAINRSKIQKTVQLLRKEKIKNKKVKIEISE